MPKSKFKKILVYSVFLFVIGGCAQGGGSSDSSDNRGSADSGFSVVPPRGDGTALISWTPPTLNTDGSALTDLAGYRIRYGTSSGSYSVTITLGTELTSYMVENLGVSDWFFVMTAFNSSGIESSYSTEVHKAIN